MLISHRTLRCGGYVTDLTLLKGIQPNSDRIVFAQGAKMHVIDPGSPHFPVIESYQFRSPIQFIIPIHGDDMSVFVMLRSYKWFVFRMPTLVQSGSLYRRLLCKPRRQFLGHASVLEQRLATHNSTSASALLLKEERVLYCVHPDYAAVNLYSGFVYVYALRDHLREIEIMLEGCDVVDMAFIEPASIGCKLVLILDRRGNRVLQVYRLLDNRSMFVEDVTHDLPKDAYAIIPLKLEMESVVIVVARDRVVRITHVLDMPDTVDYLPTFLPMDGLIMYHCHMYDNVYLMCDASGNLIVGNFPMVGQVKTEIVHNVGFASCLVNIDGRRFVVGRPFGESVIYEFEPGANRFEVREIGTIDGIGPVVGFARNEFGTMCGTGRGVTGCVRVFGQVIQTNTIAELEVSGCLNLFIVMHRDELCICMMFYDDTRFVIFDGYDFRMLESEFIEERKGTILFHRLMTGIIYVTDCAMSIIDPDVLFGVQDVDEFSKPVRRDMDSSIITAAACNEYIVVADTKPSIMVVNAKTLSNISQIEVDTQPLLVAAAAECIAAYMAGNYILILKCEGGPTQRIDLRMFDTPASLVISPLSNDIHIGTTNGCLLTIPGAVCRGESRFTADMIEEVPIGEEVLVLHENEGKIISSGENPFLLGAQRLFIAARKCHDIGQVGDFVCCLHDVGVSIMKLKTDVAGGLPQLAFRIPGLVRYVRSSLTNDKMMICLSETPALEQVLIGMRGRRETLKVRLPKENRVSVFRTVEIGGDQFVVIGDDSCTITLMNADLHVLAVHKVLAMPTAVCSYGKFLVVARLGAVDFYTIKDMGGSYELELKTTGEGHSLCPDMITVNDYVIVSDQRRALIVYRVIDDAAKVVSMDNQPRRLNKLASIGTLVFAASYDSTVYCYQLQDDGDILEIGSFQCDARVISFHSLANKLIYGTVYGGVGCFESTDDGHVRALKDALAFEPKWPLCDRVPSSVFEYAQRKAFVDIDELEVLTKCSPDFAATVLDRVHLTRHDVDAILTKFTQGVFDTFT